MENKRTKSPKLIFSRRFLTRFMLGVLLISILMSSLQTPPSADALPQQVEIFDVASGRVARRIPMTPEIRLEAERWVGSISGVISNVNPAPKEGIIIGIPLTPPLAVNNAWLRDRAKALFLVLNRTNLQHPTLLLLNEEDQPLLYQTAVDASPFLQQYNLGDLLQSRSSEVIRQVGSLTGNQLLELLDHFRRSD